MPIVRVYVWNVNICKYVLLYVTSNVDMYNVYLCSMSNVLKMYICIYVRMYMYVCICTYVYVCMLIYAL